jgi:hypothetical protein
MHSLKIFAALFYFTIISVNAQDWVWAYTAGLHRGVDITTDTQGNIISVAFGTKGAYGAQKLPSPTDFFLAQHNS